MINSDHFYYYERSLKRNIFGYINDQPKYHFYYIKCSLPHPNKGSSVIICVIRKVTRGIIFYYQKDHPADHILLLKRSHESGSIVVDKTPYILLSSSSNVSHRVHL